MRWEEGAGRRGWDKGLKDVNCKEGGRRKNQRGEEELGVRESEKGRSKESGVEVRRIREKEGKGSKEERGGNK